VFWYARKYQHLLFGNLRELEYFKDSTKANIVKALIILSKYLGIHQQFKQRLVNYGIKVHRLDSLNSFLRIFNNNNDVLNWFKEASSVLRENERLFLKFCLLSGLRRIEAIQSFNKIIEVYRENKLEEYYNPDLQCLMHFKYPRDFIRRTKNCFISFIPEYLIYQIVNSEPVSYNEIRKRLQRKGIKVRINELRDLYGTFMLHHGLLEQEVNLLQGRIPPSIFVKHYWNPRLSDLRDRVLKALNELEQTI
jgi:intergrase/recombinase